MARRTIALSIGVVLVGSAFFAIVFSAAQGTGVRDPGATVLTCSDGTPVPEPAAVTDFDDLDPRHRPAFVRATAEQFADVPPETARYFEVHDAVRYRGTVYHCETNDR